MIPPVLSGHASSISYLLWTRNACYHAFTNKLYAFLQFLTIYVNPFTVHLHLQVRSTGS